MKLRFRKNSVRLRVNQREVAELAAGEAVEEQVSFPGQTRFSYVLRSSELSHPQASYSEGELLVSAPRQAICRWASTDEIGIYFELPADGMPLKIAIEKDLECLDGPVEERDPFAFPRPDEKTC